MDNPQLQLEPRQAGRCVVGTQYSARTSTQEDSAADIADAYALTLKCCSKQIRLLWFAEWMAPQTCWMTLGFHRLLTVFPLGKGNTVQNNSTTRMLSACHRGPGPVGTHASGPGPVATEPWLRVRQAQPRPCCGTLP